MNQHIQNTFAKQVTHLIELRKRERERQIKFKLGTIFFTILGGGLLTFTTILFIKMMKWALYLAVDKNVTTPLFIIGIVLIFFTYKTFVVFIEVASNFFKKVNKW